REAASSRDMVAFPAPTLEREAVERVDGPCWQPAVNSRKTNKVAKVQEPTSKLKRSSKFQRRKRRADPACIPARAGLPCCRRKDRSSATQPLGHGAWCFSGTGSLEPRAFTRYALKSSARMGNLRKRLPVTAKIALASAGATGGTPGSPTPPIRS